LSKINKKVKERALEWVQEVNLSFDNLSDRMRDKWYDWWNMYRSFENQQKLPGQSNIFIPKVYEVIEKKVPAVIANSPRFIVTPRSNDANQYIGIIRDTIGFWWDEDDMQGKLEKLVKDSFIFGVGFLKVDWYQEMKTETTMEYGVDEETGETIEKEVEEDVVSFERPTADLVSIFDIKVDPRVEDFQEGVGVMHYNNDIRYGELMNLGEMYDLSDIDGLDPEQLFDDGFTSEEERDQEDDLGINVGNPDIDKNRMVTADFYGLFSESGEPEDEKEYIITAVVVDNEPTYIIRCEENTFGFRPLVKLDDRVVRGEFYSVGEIEPLEGLQIEYNNLRNARIDFNNAVNYPEWIYNVNAGINPANLVHRPNNIIPVELPLGSDIRSVLRPVDKPTQPVSGYNEESQMNRDFQSISQTIDFTDRGGSQGFTNTATGVKSRDVQVGLQASNIVSHLETAIAEVGRMWLALAEEFSEDEVVIKRPRTEEDIMNADEMSEPVPSLEEVPDKFTKIPKEVLTDVVNNFKVKVEAGSTTADTAAGKAQDAVNIANTSVQFAGMGVPVNLTEVYKKILRDAHQVSNPEELLTAPQQPQMMPGEEGMSPGGGMESTPGAAQGGKVPLQPSQPNQPMG